MLSTFGFEGYLLSGDVIGKKQALNFEMAFLLKCVDLTFPVGDQPDCDALNASGTQILIARTDLAPQHGAQFESDYAIQHPTGLLRHHEVHVHGARAIYRRFDRRPCDLMKHDPLGRYRIKAQHLAQMPTDSFALTILVRCEPDFVRSFCQRPQFADDLLLFIRNNIARFKIVFDIDPHAGLLQVADMAIAAIYLKIRSEDLFDGLCFCRAFNY